MEFGEYSNIGEDNEYVFRGLLGMGESDVQALMEDGLLY